MLTCIILLPLLAALVIVPIPARYRFLIRSIALGTTLGTLLLATSVFLGFEGAEAGAGGYKYVTRIRWVPGLDINYFVGVDGVNVGLIFMAALVAFAAVCVSWEIKTQEKSYYFLLLVMIGGIFGAFASLDLLFFYSFHEFALIPTFIMIGVWGRGENRNYATFQMALYLSAGALLALVGLIALYLQVPVDKRTFDLVALTAHFKDNPMPMAVQQWIFPVLLFGFGILVSLWPFHTWAPLGYAAAPTATAMLHAGVLKKFGLYGLIRIALPLLPAGTRPWLTVLACLCLGNILHCGWVAMRQRDLNQLIGNSSVAHMGFVFLGIASLNLIGVTGAILLMIAHGLLAALTFGLSGYLRAQTGTLNMDELGGLLRQLPFVGAALLMAMLAGCGLPGFANFVGEISVMFGAWKGAFGHARWFVLAAAWGGLVIGAVYMLRAVRRILHGETPEAWAQLVDATPWRRTPFVLLLAGLIFFGFWPRSLADKIKPSAERIVRLATGQPDKKTPGRRFMTEEKPGGSAAGGGKI
ncbi:MAG TPA: NADH-quinone oxidoreductase subunit M [Verrucomicrobiae bacterium]|nr:NADH-quinone oxidoreductase subunit M [Verrucomicrobiae bacterium]